VDEVAREWRIVGDRGPSDPWLAPEAVIPCVSDDEEVVIHDGIVMPKRTADMFHKRYHPVVKTWGQYRDEADQREAYRNSGA
jgi:hypothetical protein